MSRELIETLRNYADKAEAGDKLHWAAAMRVAAEYIRADLDKPLPRPINQAKPVPESIAKIIEQVDEGNDPTKKIVWANFEAIDRVSVGDNLYAEPARNPLSDDEIIDMYFDGFSIGELLEFARAIEKAHGIKE